MGGLLQYYLSYDRGFRNNKEMRVSYECSFCINKVYTMHWAEDAIWMWNYTLVNSLTNVGGWRFSAPESNLRSPHSLSGQGSSCRSFRLYLINYNTLGRIFHYTVHHYLLPRSRVPASSMQSMSKFMWPRAACEGLHKYFQIRPNSLSSDYICSIYIIISQTN